VEDVDPLEKIELAEKDLSIFGTVCSFASAGPVMGVRARVWIRLIMVDCACADE